MPRKTSLTNEVVRRAQPEGKPYEIRDTELPGLLLRVQPTGVMTYYFQYERTKRMKLGCPPALTPDLARKAAKRIEAERRVTGVDPIQQKKRVQSDNYLQFLDDTYSDYLKTNLRNGVNNDENVKETLNSLKNTFPEFHRLGLNEITPLLIDKWKQRRRKEGVKPATINRQMNDLCACFNRAVKWGAMTSNPFDKVERTKIDSGAKVRYLSSDEETTLRASLDSREAEIRADRESANQWRAERDYKLYADLDKQTFVDHLKPAVLLSLNTGLRRGELFSLRWSDIDFDRKNLTVVGDVAKDGETRHIPLNQEALEVLKQWKKQPGIKSQWLFYNEQTGSPVQNLRKSWVAVLAKAKIVNFRWHDLRHTFASKLVMAGVDLNTVRELLGHSDYKMTLRYAHLAPKHKQEAVDKLVAVLV